VAQTLQQVAHENNVAVVTMNHMTTRVADNTGRSIVPALGEQWFHAVSHRLLLKWEQTYRVAEVRFHTFNDFISQWNFVLR
jgi:hypothetical protein